jgi:hypothetical protein
MVKSPSLWKLAKEFSTNSQPLSILPVSAKRKLCQTLIMAGSAKFDEEENKNEYWQLVSQVVSAFFTECVGVVPVASKLKLDVVSHNFCVVCRS